MSSEHGVQFRRDGTEVQVRINTDLPHVNNPGGSIFTFTFECSTPHSAELLVRYLRKRHNDAMRAIRKTEYELGWSDAKGHRVRKADWFASSMRQNAWR